MRRIALSFAVVALFASGCAKPIAFRLDVAGPPSAQATVRPITAGSTASPTNCQTPCDLEFEPDTVYEIRLRADGYHSARVDAEYNVIVVYEQVADEEPPRLVIPMLPRTN